MSGGQIAALALGVILLIPGGCFTLLGIGMLGGAQSYDPGHTMLITGVVILSIVAVLGWIAFRKRKPPQAPGQPET